MLKIRDFKVEKEINGVLYGVAEITVDDASELSTSSGNMVFTGSSVAWAVNTGEWFGLNSSNEWVKQGGAEASRSLSAPKNTESNIKTVVKAELPETDTVEENAHELL